MKHILYTILLLLALMTPAISYAYDIEVDGIYYDIYDNEATVTYKNYSSYTYYYSDYSGDVTIPSSISFGGKTYSVTSIGEYAFYNCSGLTSVNIPNSVTSIAGATFYGCSGLTSVNIPNSITSIAGATFYDCSSLTSINIPNSVTQIDGWAFYGCSSLTSVHIPSSVTRIEGGDAFGACNSLSRITVASDNLVYDSRNNCNAIINTYDNSLHVGCKNTVIPNTVTAIRDEAFLDCSSLTSLIIPNGVTFIGGWAFQNCCNLTNVTIPATVTYIGYSAFYGCSSITKINIPNSVELICNNAFMGCNSLSSITVESGNPVYDSRSNCNAIIETASNTLISGCQHTTIPSSVTAIDENAFYNNTGLKSIIIPQSIKRIGYSAFSGCTNLKDIFTKISQLSEFSYGDDIFKDVPTSTCVLHVPYGTSRIYKSMSQWREFSNIVEMNNASDANGDNEVNIADVNYIIDLILSGIYDPNADANEDGELNIADVNEVISHILDGEKDPYTEYGYRCLNGIYRSMYTPGWTTTANTHQCFGISAYNLMAEVMGDDFIMGAPGSGWFWYDAAYNVKSRYTSSAWRSYDLWFAYYTWIANANVILSLKDYMTSPDANYVLGQAYAIRAYSYFMLAQSFARTYKGHEGDPCVPLFTGTSLNGSTGQPRATNSQVYEQIDTDITNAILLLQGTKQQRPEHIGLAVALGLKARIALVEENWLTALSAAEAAINASNCVILDVPSFMGLNDATASNVMWGADIPADDVSMYASLFAHMSTDISYGQRAPKQISTWLYNKMNSTDARRTWWDPTSEYSYGGYVQRKFDFSNLSTWEGDYIWMRVEEMYLTAAEAACRLGNESTAKSYLMQLMNKRDPYYTCNKSGGSLALLTTDEVGSLLEEILLQRRLELWGEDGRIYTIRRMHQGFERISEYGWPSELEIPDHAYAAKDPESYLWVLTIPQAEFDGNPYMNPEPFPNGDQNPIGDYPG